MLQRLVRVGPSRQRVGKAYVASAEVSADVFKELDSGGPIRVQRDPRNRCGLLLVSELVWTHGPAARASLFQALLSKLKHCSSVLVKRGVELNPTAVGNGERWRQRLCSDRHSVELFDEIEQAQACNLLGKHASTLQACSGRAAVAPTSVEHLHSRMGAESLYFAPVEWLSTSPEHLERMQRFLKETEGISRPERLEVFPSRDGAIPTLNSAVADGAAFLSTTLAMSILHQAMVMKARRLVRDGAEPILGWRASAERNRARVITDGPSAVLEPNRELARERLFRLITDLRHELQTLDVTFDELAPVILGPALRKMGRGGLCTENDYMKQMVRLCVSRRQDAIAEVRKASIDNSLDNPVTRANELAFPKESAAIREWWAEELLLVATHDSQGRVAISKPLRPARGIAAPARSTQGPAQRRQPGAKPSQGQQKQRGASPATRLLALLKENSSSPAAALVKARAWIEPKNFGRSIAELPDEDKATLRNTLAPGSGRHRPVPSGTEVWSHDLGRKAMGLASSGGIAVIALEDAPDATDRLRARASELFATCPPGLLLLSWKWIKAPDRLRQEFLLVASENRP